MKQLIFLIFICTIAKNASGQRIGNDYFWGIKAGAVFPTNLGRANDEVGFKDVASTGTTAGATVGWQYNERLSLAVAFNYQYLPKRSSFWNVESKGNFSANYQASSMLIEGNYYFNNAQCRPYCGVNFGMHYLRNLIDFDSRYSGSDNDASIRYVATQWKPGLGFCVGLLMPFTKNTDFVFESRLCIIPYLKEEMVPIMDGDLILDYFTKNPHGNQNQIGFTIGINFKM